MIRFSPNELRIEAANWLGYGAQTLHDMLMQAAADAETRQNAMAEFEAYSKVFVVALSAVKEISTTALKDISP